MKSIGKGKIINDFTTGPLFTTLVKFSLPYMLSNFLQVIYSVVDMVVVGHCIGHGGMAAVAVASRSYGFLVLLCVGLMAGAQVYLAQMIAFSKALQNGGNQAAGAAAQIAVSDLFDPVLQDIVVTLDGETLTAVTDYTYDQAGGRFSTVPGRITVYAATFAQTLAGGVWTVTPGEAVLTVEGTV